MSRDYGNKRRATRKKTGFPGSLLTIACSFLCGYLAASLLDIASISDWIMKNVVTHKQPATRVEAKVHPPAKIKPKFEFYTLLSKDNSAPQPAHHPAAPTQPVAAVKVAPQPLQAGVLQKPASTEASHSVQVTDGKPVKRDNPLVKEFYQIQLAAFNKKEDAEHMKASLVLSGFDASITSISHNNVTWFRVIVGPFASLSETEKVQMRMVRIEHVKGMIRHVTG